MKTKIVILAAAIALNQTAFAQTSTTSAPAPDAAANSSVATDNTAAAATGVSPGAKYLGIMHGPGMDFSGAHQSANNGKEQLVIDNRPKIFAKIGSDIEAGIEPRFNTFFGNGQQMKATAGNMRLFGNFKHVYKDDVLDLALIPRAFLPTSTKYRNAKLTVSPDLIADLAISPKNSRFSIDSGLEYIHMFHTAGATGADYTDTTTAVFAPWLEVDYQLTAKTQLMVSYWPELIANARNGSPLHSDSNEVDVGAYYEVAKGWQVAPFVAIEPYGMDPGARLGNLQLNLMVIGTIL